MVSIKIVRTIDLVRRVTSRDTKMKSIIYSENFDDRIW